MKTLFVFLAILFIACEECGFKEGRGNPPPAPYGTPDDITDYVSGEYRSIDYIYYCKNRQYINVGYTSTDECSDWEVSEYRSGGICD